MNIITSTTQWDTQFWEDDAGWHGEAQGGGRTVRASASTYEGVLDAIIDAIKGEEYMDEEGNE